jgi:iron(III) transport system ATP-binding protein
VTPAHIVVADVSKRFGPTSVLKGVSLDVAPGSIVALLGPSGCGKTTLLRVIAGLERPESGSVRVGDEILTGDGTFVPPERRRIGMVFQDWALFPHMSVADNVRYGLGRDAPVGRVDDALTMVGLSGLGDRQPGTLSGGQQQRVALARAIAPQPRCLLLDEPFSNLDTALRVQVRTEVHQLLAELDITCIFVTHDQAEAFVLGEQVAVMDKGVIVQHGTPSDLYERPVTPWVAGFVGEANLLAGTVDGGTAATSVGPVPLSSPVEGSVSVLARPEALRLADGDTATVELVEYYGHDTLYVVRLDGADTVRVRSGAGPRWRRGDRVTVTHGGAPANAWPAS